MCNKKANKIRESIDTREGRSNIKYQGQVAIRYKVKPMIRSVNETIRWIDSIKVENQYINEKFGDKADFIDTEARINIKGLI